jgi:hypothetical protein
VSKQVPEHAFDEAALADEAALVLEDELEVARIVDDDARRQSGYGDLEGLVAELALALDEPGKQLLARLQEQDAIAQQRQRVWGFPGRSAGGGR